MYLTVGKASKGTGGRIIPESRAIGCGVPMHLAVRLARPAKASR